MFLTQLYSRYSTNVYVLYLKEHDGQDTRMFPDFIPYWYAYYDCQVRFFFILIFDNRKYLGKKSMRKYNNIFYQIKFFSLCSCID